MTVPDLSSHFCIWHWYCLDMFLQNWWCFERKLESGKSVVVRFFLSFFQIPWKIRNISGKNQMSDIFFLLFSICPTGFCNVFFLMPSKIIIFPKTIRSVIWFYWQISSKFMNFCKISDFPLKNQLFWDEGWVWFVTLINGSNSIVRAACRQRH